jgi:LytS/YehU family sensor histidine kinase
MKKEELVAKLEVAKEVTSVVSIDLMLAALGMLEETQPKIKTGLTQELADEIANRIERTLDYNADDLVEKDGITFEIVYGNQLEIDNAQINVGETMEHITAVLDGFIVGEDEVVDENETGHTLPGFEEGIGLDNLNIRLQEDRQGI